jgi:very-short-patch-repair endonuclease
MGRSKHFADEGREDDGRRTAYLDVEGVRVVRFSNRELFEETDNVLGEIRRARVR